MPSAEHLKEKQAVIDEIKGKLEKATSAVLIDYIGATVAEADAMRKKLRESDVDYTVYKNTLMQRAIGGTGYAALSGALSGPSALAISYADAITPARVLSGIFKDYKKMAFKAGVIEGIFYDEEGLTQIASLPTRDGLIAQFLGSIQAPLSKLVRTFQAIADAGDGGTRAKEETAEAPAAEAPAAKTADAGDGGTPAKGETAAEAAAEEPATEAKAADE